MRSTQSRSVAASIATTMLLFGGVGSIGGSDATVTIGGESASASRAGVSASRVGASVDDGAAPIPVVDGNRLVDERTGEQFVPRGVDWPSFEYACRQGWAYSAPIREQDAAALEAWHVSIVRLPLNQDCWLGLEGAPVSDPWHTRTVAGYRDRVETWVNRLNAHGIVVLLDLHWSAPAGQQADAQRAMADAQSVDFWTSVGTRFADHPSVMFDLFNEPYSKGSRYPLDWDCWADGGCELSASDDENGIDEDDGTYEATGMNDLVAAVRGAGAEQPIVLSGLDYANELGARPGTPGVDWLSSRPDDDQLVAGWHAYPGQQCDDRSCWNDEIAPVAAEVPLLITETGQDHAYATQYLDGLWSWALDHDLGWMQWAWWVFEPGEGDPGFRYEIIVDDVDYEPTPGPGSLLRWGLAATASGARTLTASGAGSGSSASTDGTVKLKGSVRAGDETTVMVWLHGSDGNGVARVRLTAKGGAADQERASRRVELFDEWTPITLRLHADADHDKLRLEVDGGVRMRDVRGIRIR